MTTFLLALMGLASGVIGAVVVVAIREWLIVRRQKR